MEEFGYVEEKMVLGAKPVEVSEYLHTNIAYQSIVAILFKDRNNRIQCGTGVMISRTIILTAAHNIYDKNAK